jgi:hypothetical protein
MMDILWDAEWLGNVDLLFAFSLLWRLSNVSSRKL